MFEPRLLVEAMVLPLIPYDGLRGRLKKRYIWSRDLGAILNLEAARILFQTGLFVKFFFNQLFSSFFKGQTNLLPTRRFCGFTFRNAPFLCALGLPLGAFA